MSTVSQFVLGAFLGMSCLMLAYLAVARKNIAAAVGFLVLIGFAIYVAWIG